MVSQSGISRQEVNMNLKPAFIQSKVLLVTFLIALSFVLSDASGQEHPRNKEAQLMYKQLLCALDRGPCDSLGNHIKKALPEIIGNNCRSCNLQQKANADKVAKFIQTTFPDMWRELVRKYAVVL